MTFIVNPDPDLDPGFREVSVLSGSQGNSLESSTSNSSRAATEHANEYHYQPSSVEAPLKNAAGEHHPYLPPVTKPSLSVSTEHSGGPIETPRALPSSHFASALQPAHHVLDHVTRSEQVILPSIEPYFERDITREGTFTHQMEVEADHETAFLLSHFAEVPGHWMDLFDLQSFFA